MPLQTQPRQVVRLVRLLTDPNPEFVSLVEHGANQTPFRAVKVADFQTNGGDDMPNARSRTLKNESGTTSEATVTRAAPKAEVAVVRAVRFAGNNFESEEVVKSYLKDHDYDLESIEVEKKGDDYRAVSKAGGEVTDIRDLPLGGGVVLEVGTVKADTVTTDEEGTEETAKGAFDTQVQRYNEWLAMFSQGKTLDEVMRDGADGLPPGIYEVNDAFYTALRNALTDKDTTAVRSLTKDFGELIIKMAETFESATIPANDLVEKLFAVETKDDDTVTKTDTVANDATTSKDEPTPAQEPATKADDAKEGVDGGAAAEDETAASTNDDLPAVVAREVAVATADAVSGVDALQAAFKSFSEEVSGALAASKEALDDMAETVKSSEARVSALEEVRQTRRGADDDDGDGSAPTESGARHRTLKGSEDPLVRNSMGFMGGSAR